MPKAPKPKRVVCREFLDFIKEQNCVVPGCSIKGVDPNHIQTKGARGSDLRALPFCRPHHGDFHSMGVDTFQEKKLFNIPYSEFHQMNLEKFLLERVDLSAPEKPKIAPQLRSFLEERYIHYYAWGHTYKYKEFFNRHDWFWTGRAWFRGGVPPWHPEIEMASKLKGISLQMTINMG